MDPQGTGELMVIDVFNVFLRHKHLVILKRLPPILRLIASRVEYDAVRVKMRIERARRFMLKKRRHDVAGVAIRVAAGLTNARGCKLFQLCKLPSSPPRDVRQKCARPRRQARRWKPTSAVKT